MGDTAPGSNVALLLPLPQWPLQASDPSLAGQDCPGAGGWSPSWTTKNRVGLCGQQDRSTGSLLGQG